MDRSTSPLAVLLVAATLAACSTPGDDLLQGVPYPAAWSSMQIRGGFEERVPETMIAWHFRTDDCLSCDSFDYAVRRIQATFGDSVPLVAVHIGSRRAESIPRHFFGSRRISVARHITVSERQFRRIAGEPAVPALVIVRNGRVAWSSSRPDGIVREAQIEELVQVLARQ